MSIPDNVIDDTETTCPSCKQRIDPDVCGCGLKEKDHTIDSGHLFVPMGCVCFYAVEGCDCIHLASEHDKETGACLAINPIFGPCPCAATSEEIRQEQWKMYIFAKGAH